MGQILLNDNIPSLVHASTTTVTLAATYLGQPTRITVGGQQYLVPSTVTLNAATVGANGLDTGALAASQTYYVYAVVNQSDYSVALVASTVSPATGPTHPSGYGTAETYIGVFLTNSSSNISGTTVPVGLQLKGSLPGVVSGSSVVAGYVGEYQEALSSGAVSMTTGQYGDGGNAGLTLQPGVYDIHSTHFLTPAATTKMYMLLLGIGTVTGNSSTGMDTVRNCQQFQWGTTYPLITGGNSLVYSTPVYRVRISVATTYYPKSYCSFDTSTLTGYATIFARRVI